jgi:hypothetical protein
MPTLPLLPLAEVGLAPISEACYNINYETGCIMRNSQARARHVGVVEPRSTLASPYQPAGRRVQNSPANPLRTALYGAKFRCRQVRPNQNQVTDIRYIFDVERVLFDSWKAFFPAIREMRTDEARPLGLARAASSMRD